MRPFRRNGAPSPVPSPARIRSTIASVVDQPSELRELRLVHKALADVNRLRIVRRLAEAEATVAELVDQVGLSQPLVSWHLGRLRAAGLVDDAPERPRDRLPARARRPSRRSPPARRPILGIAGAAGREQAAS